MDRNIAGDASVMLPDGHELRGSAWVYVPTGRQAFGVFTVCWGNPRLAVNLGGPITLTFKSGKQARIVGKEANIIQLHFTVDGEV